MVIVCRTVILIFQIFVGLRKIYLNNIDMIKGIQKSLFVKLFLLKRIDDGYLVSFVRKNVFKHCGVFRFIPADRRKQFLPLRQLKLIELNKYFEILMMTCRAYKCGCRAALYQIGTSRRLKSQLLNHVNKKIYLNLFPLKYSEAEYADFVTRITT